MLTRERVIAVNARKSLHDVLARHAFGKELFVVCDDATWVAAGQDLHAELVNSYHATPHSLGRNVQATLQHARELIEAAKHTQGFIAVGAGTVNDVTKYAAAQLGKPYICVPTAASMNGYTSATASLVEEGVKHSLVAAPPVAVIADIAVIAAAPKRLARAGFGDTLCRSSVEIDMMLSHFLLGTPYPKTIFDRLRRHEPGLIAVASKLREQERACITLLMEALLDGGDAMAEFGSSAIASQGEHMIAHTAHMIYGSEMNHITHGEAIAVTTLTMSQLQQKMLLAQPIVKTLIRQETNFQRLFGKQATEALMSTYRRKVLSSDQVTDITAYIQQHWPHMKQQFSDVMLPAKTVERAFMLAAVPLRPEDIHLDRERYNNAANHAYMTRDRFTFLDLAAMNNKIVQH